MADTLLRLGLWIIILVLVVFIGRESLEIGILQDAVEHSLLLLVGKIGLAIVALGGVLKVFGSVAPKKKSRCRICKRPIPPGDIYCRQHLREVLEDEDIRHRTLNVRRPDV
jgi:predicted nucleic acid-binding Zn ribbon protein